MKEESKMSQVPVFNLRKHSDKIVFPIEFDLVDLAKEFGIFPLKVVFKNGRKKLLLAMRDPEMKDVMAEVEFRSNLPVIPVLASQRDIEYLIRRYYHLDQTARLPEEVAEGDITQDAFDILPYVKGAY